MLILFLSFTVIQKYLPVEGLLYHGEYLLISIRDFEIVTAHQ